MLSTMGMGEVSWGGGGGEVQKKMQEKKKALTRISQGQRRAPTDQWVEFLHSPQSVAGKQPKALTGQSKAEKNSGRRRRSSRTHRSGFIFASHVCF